MIIKKYIFVLYEVTKDRLDDSAIAAGAKYSFNITKSKKKVYVYTAMKTKTSFMLMM